MVINGKITRAHFPWQLASYINATRSFITRYNGNNYRDLGLFEFLYCWGLLSTPKGLQFLHTWLCLEIHTALLPNEANGGSRPNFIVMYSIEKCQLLTHMQTRSSLTSKIGGCALISYTLFGRNTVYTQWIFILERVHKYSVLSNCYLTLLSFPWKIGGCSRRVLLYSILHRNAATVGRRGMLSVKGQRHISFIFSYCDFLGKSTPLPGNGDGT